MFPNQIWLSQKMAVDQVAISQALETDAHALYEFPRGTYAYTTSEPMVFLWDKPVSIESFWLRLHRAPNPFTQREMGFKTIRVYNGIVLVAESKVTLVSDEWFLIMPAQGEIVGTRLEIEGGTDLDSLVMQWG